MTLLQLEDWERDMILSFLSADLGSEDEVSNDIIKLVEQLTKPEEAKIKLKFQVFVSNNGDGSAFPFFFNTKEEAKECAHEDIERLCDDIFPYTITINGLGQIKGIPKCEED